MHSRTAQGAYWLPVMSQYLKTVVSYKVDVTRGGHRARGAQGSLGDLETRAETYLFVSSCMCDPSLTVSSNRLFDIWT